MLKGAERNIWQNWEIPDCSEEGSALIEMVATTLFFLDHNPSAISNQSHVVNLLCLYCANSSAWAPNHVRLTSRGKSVFEVSVHLVTLLA